jgi:hypothetical protein
MSTTLTLISRFIRVEVEIRRWEDYLTLMPASSDLSTARVLDLSCSRLFKSPRLHPIPFRDLLLLFRYFLVTRPTLQFRSMVEFQQSGLAQWSLGKRSDHNLVCKMQQVGESQSETTATGVNTSDQHRVRPRHETV